MLVKLITVAREFGTNVDSIFEKLAKEYNFLLLNRKNLTSYLSKYLEISEEDLIIKEKEIEKGKYEDDFSSKYVEGIKNVVDSLLKRSSVILMGRGGQVIFKNYPDTIHVNIIAPLKYRIENLIKEYNLDINTTKKLIEEKDRERETYFRMLFNEDWKNPYLYHLILNLSYYTSQEIYEIIVKSIEKPKKNIPDSQESFTLTTPVNFANKSEEEFAKLLTFYRIKWEYEPHTFPLEWDSEGQIIEAFTPDFYLPEFNLYIELTVQKPKLMTEKLRKIRKLRELYPHINIKLLYGKDYLKILEKYGAKVK